MWGVGARQMRLGVLDDAGVVVIGLNVQLMDVVKMVVGQDVLREGGVGAAECFVGDNKQINHEMGLCGLGGDGQPEKGFCMNKCLLGG